MIEPLFEPGREYRRRELHARFGGQRQGGISTPRQNPIIFLFTGASGQQYGYGYDGYRDEDGTFWYTGEGQVGDMKMAGGNRAIAEHAARGKSLHLFHMSRRAHVRYMGQATCLSHHRADSEDRQGNERSALVFVLQVEPDLGSGEPREEPPPEDLLPGKRARQRSLPELRDIAVRSARAEAGERERQATVYVRSRAVRLYVLQRAAGVCEACDSEAPFVRPTGEAYLEAHHIRSVSDSGPDHPRWVAAVCPNCHREVHHGKDGKELDERLSEEVGRLEGGAALRSRWRKILS